MMLMSFKLDWKKLITFFAVALVLAGALAGLRWATAAWWRSDAVSVRITRHSGATEEERQRFIASFGWTVPAAPEEVKEVLIPREFDEVYIQYNNLQKKTGLRSAQIPGQTLRPLHLQSGKLSRGKRGRSPQPAGLQRKNHRRRRDEREAGWIYARIRDAGVLRDKANCDILAVMFCAAFIVPGRETWRLAVWIN